MPHPPVPSPSKRAVVEGLFFSAQFLAAGAVNAVVRGETTNRRLEACKRNFMVSVVVVLDNNENKWLARGSSISSASFPLLVHRQSTWKQKAEGNVIIASVSCYANTQR